VGINTAIYAPSGGNVGIGFAIPANMTAAIIQELIDTGSVNRGYVGAVVQPLNRELAKAFAVLPADGAPAGVVIVDVQPASSAEKAGLTPGDVIVQMGDKKITSVADFENQAAVMFIGDRLDIVLVRQGEQQTLTLEIFADTQEQVAGQRITPRLNGVVLQNLSAADDLGGGVLVAEVMINSSAYAYGLRSGDIIVGANRNTVTDIAQLREAVRRDNRRLMLRVYRNGRFGPITIR
jgi:S1-C subfamily serine protease